MKKLKILLLTLLFSILSCSDLSNDCEIECTSGPARFTLELVDSETGENLFTNGTFEESQLRLSKISDEGEGQWQFISTDDLNLIGIATFQGIAYSVQISGDELFQVSIDAESVTDDCCSFTRVNDFEITGASFEQDSETSVFKVKIDTASETE